MRILTPISPRFLNQTLDLSILVGIAYFAGFFEDGAAPHNSAYRAQIIY